MLKILPAPAIQLQPRHKCGEIFCHSPNDFTIFCKFCAMKSFNFEDFILHIKNLHFENNLLKLETFQSDATNCKDNAKEAEAAVKLEINIAADDEQEVLWDNIDQYYDEEDGSLSEASQHDLVGGSGNDKAEPEEVIRVLKRQSTRKKKKTALRCAKQANIKRKSSISGSSDEDNCLTKTSRDASAAETDDNDEDDEDYKPLKVCFCYCK